MNAPEHADDVLMRAGVIAEVRSRAEILDAAVLQVLKLTNGRQDDIVDNRDLVRPLLVQAVEQIAAIRLCLAPNETPRADCAEVRQ